MRAFCAQQELTTARLTDEKVILEEDDLTELDEKIALLGSHLKEKPEITLVYFMKDALKEGGSYREITG